jgi:hypothetical protein
MSLHTKVRKSQEKFRRWLRSQPWAYLLLGKAGSNATTKLACHFRTLMKTNRTVEHHIWPTNRSKEMSKERQRLPSYIDTNLTRVQIMTRLHLYSTYTAHIVIQFHHHYTISMFVYAIYLHIIWIKIQFIPHISGVILSKSEICYSFWIKLKMKIVANGLLMKTFDSG